MSMHSSVRWSTALLVATALVATACADTTSDTMTATEATFPSETITLIVGGGKGGGGDAWARSISQVAQSHCGDHWVVVNTEGAGGLLAWRQMLDAPADGYTIAFASPSWPLNAIREENSDLDPIDDANNVAYVSDLRTIVLSRPGTEWSNWEGLVAHAEGGGEPLTLGAAGVTLIAAAALFNQAGIQDSLILVPYDDTSDAVADFLGDHIDLVATTDAGAIPLIPSDAAAVVNVSNIPTTDEALEGVPMAEDLGYSGTSFPRMVWVHPDTPEDISNFLSDCLKDITEDDAFKGLIRRFGEEVVYVPRAEAQAQYEEFVKNARELIPTLFDE